MFCVRSLASQRPRARVPLIRAASVLAAPSHRSSHLDRRAYPCASLGEPEIIDRLQYILRPSTSTPVDVRRDTRQLFDELHAIVNMAARTLDTLTHMKPPIDRESSKGGRTIELEITAEDLHKILMLAAANAMRAESRQSLHPISKSPLKSCGPANCNACRFASTCASRGPDSEPSQHSGGALAMAAVAAALFGTGAALEHKEEAADAQLNLHMSSADISNLLACVQ
ncbi:hypothetical protein IWW39_004494 [Coemansia spiralis]|uniref:Uncharacterized protein n=1 Tax=Coemansia spiralis TaxID=417178 RepID=A0A9W8GH15_9FUNG|nr:hypothetical protein IWW39_004494 [Coemansia spiralis]